MTRYCLYDHETLTNFHFYGYETRWTSFGFWLIPWRYFGCQRLDVKEIPYCHPIYLIPDGEKLPLHENLGTRLVSQSRINLATVKNWLTTCRDYHGNRCERHNWGAILTNPARLLLVDVVEMYLVVAPPSCRYVALSYVWGGVKSREISMGNARRVDLKLIVKELPATIVDAMEVTRRIGMRFLWVDDLCIQDCHTTKKESQFDEMDKIYGNAQIIHCRGSGKQRQ